MSYRLLIDQNFDERLVAALREQLPDLDLVRLSVRGLGRLDDPQVLELAADEGRIVLTHDAATMPDFAYQRLGAGLPMPGVIVVHKEHRGRPTALRVMSEALYTLLAASEPEEFIASVRHIPGEF